MVLPADKDPALPLDPSEEALNEPVSHSNPWHRNDCTAPCQLEQAVDARQAMAKPEVAMRTLIAMLVAVILVGGTVRASALTAGELLAQCEQLEPWEVQGKDVLIRNINAGVCWGYLQAVFDLAYVAWHEADKPNEPPTRPIGACLPNGISRVQFAQMFLQKARDSPAQLHEGALFMIITLLRQNFPCPK